MPQYQGVWSVQEAARLQSQQQWVTDPYYKNTTLLLQADSAILDTQNNTFLDSSSNAFAITRNGNATQGTFTPFSQSSGWWSNYFNGSTDYLLTAITGKSLGTGSFTVEAWIYAPASPVGLISSTRTVGGSDGTSFLISSQKIQITTSGTVLYTGTTTLNAGQWYHVAYVRNGSSACSVYINGVLDGTFTDSRNFSGTQLLIGGGEGGNPYFAGYISNYRITNTAVYTSAFTPPSSPLTSAYVILTCQSNRFVDNSGNNFTFTVGGTPSVQAFSPFAPQYQYDPTVTGASGYFDGTGDYLSVSPTVLGTNSFTVELWAYATSNIFQVLVGNAASAGGGDTQWQIGVNISSTGSGNVNFTGWNTTWLSASAVFRNYAWNHIAVSRNATGNGAAMWVNGTRVATATIAQNFSGTTALSIGREADNAAYFNGYISSLRIVNGAYVYDPTSSTITVPTAPPTAIANTNLLLNFTNAGIYDGTLKNDLQTVGNAQVSTSIVKYGSGSLKFSAAGDYLVAASRPLFAVGTGDFTAEGWVYLTAYSYGSIFCSWNSTAGTNGIIVGVNNTGTVIFQIGNASGGASSGFTSTTILPLNTWIHLAGVRFNGVASLYVNGVFWGSGTSTQSVGQTVPYISSYYANTPATYSITGYVDDVRFSNFARYTANFIPPSVALPRQ